MSGRVEMTARLYAATRDNALLDEITPIVNGAKVLAGTVTQDLDSAVKSTGRFTLTRPVVLDPYVSFVAAFLRLDHSDGTVIDEQVGLYALPPFAKRHGRALTTAEVAGNALEWLLALDGFASAYTVTAGTNYVAAVTAILTGAGLTRWSISATTKTLPADLTWQSDKTKLEIVNDLLEGMGNYHLAADRTGRLTSFPYLDLDTAQAAFAYDSLAGTKIVGTVDDEPLVDRVTNRVVVIRDNPSLPLLESVRENNNPASPVSIPRLNGLRIRRRIADPHLADQDAADKLADRYLQEGSSFFRKIRLQTHVDPRFSVRDVGTLDVRQTDGTIVANGRWWRSGLTLGFRPDQAAMSHSLNKLEAWR